ncbi:MAG TPA: RNA polymerase sigma factor [Fimbriimonadaceae bacterium]|jgi:RNA polymerase sigma-70 factor, ECF subfamily|nr:RNA polymerase sigma factor [Fimbriimonadaceae bacterium]HVM35043.1 RNA polymerase sigma factor [Actinomycetota bacterium]
MPEAAAVLIEGSDRDLVRLALAGEDEAFECIYRRFYPQLVGAVRPMAGDSALAEDVAQEALLRARDRIDTFDSSRPFWPWLKTIGIHVAADMRRNNREVFVEVDEPSECDGFKRCDDSLLLIQALKRIPHRQRVAIALRYMEQRDPRDAALFLGLSKPAFEQLLFRARRNLRAQYRRLSEEVAGLILIPTRWVRSVSHRAANRSRRLHDYLGQLAPGGVDQFAQVIIALVIIAGAAPEDVSKRGLVGTSPVRGPVPFTLADSQEPLPPTARPNSGPLTRPGSSSDNAQSSAGSEKVEKASVEDTADDLTKPNRGVRTPEDARITSVASDPNGAGGNVLYASGIAHCRLPSCPPVLFRSPNGGTTWNRLRATGFQGTSLIVPPDGGPSGALFAMGPTGLQVSEDGGRSFVPAAVAGAPFVVGSAAISPAFYDGDPRILIGAQTLMRYSDERRTIHPETSTALPGPLEPAFSPGYPADTRVIVGGVQGDPLLGRPVSTVFVCESSVCSASRVGKGDQVPRVHLAGNFQHNDLMLAFTDDFLFASRDGGVGFSKLPTPWRKSILRDVAIAPHGDFFAAVKTIGHSAEEGLYVSRNGGTSWHRVDDALFRNGVHRVETFGQRVLVGLGRTGIACSSDGGRTWGRRCPSS